MLDHAEVKKLLPPIGPEVVRRQLLSARRPRQFAADLPRLAHRLQARSASTICRSGRSRRSRRSGGEFRLTTAAGRASRRQGRARGRAMPTQTLAPMVGLHAPVGPTRGQIIVTERTMPFLPHPADHDPPDRRGHGDDRRQQGRRSFDDRALNHSVIAVMADRAQRMFPHARAASTWCAPGRRCA